MDLAVLGTVAAAAIVAYPAAPGLWIYLLLAVFIAGAGVFSVVSATRALKGTRPEERGKRSDDRALAKAQRSMGCLPLLPLAAFAGAALFWALNGRWPWQPWAIALGGGVGHAIAVGIIYWCRRRHYENTTELDYEPRR